MSDTFVNEDLRPHVDSHICGKCRKEITKGHRVTIARIADGKGRNPENIHEIGLHLRTEWEIVHIDCRDPLLKKGLQ